MSASGTVTHDEDGHRTLLKAKRGLERENTELKARLFDLKNGAVTQEASASGTCTCGGRYSKLKAKYATLKLQNERFETRLAQGVEDAASLAALREKLAVAQAEQAGCLQQLAESKAAVLTAKGLNDALRSEVKGLIKRSTSLAEKNHDIETQLHSCQQALLDCQAEVTAANNQSEAYAVKVRQLQAARRPAFDKESSVAESEQTKKQLDLLRSFNAALEVKVSELSIQLAEAQSNESTAKEEVASLVVKCEDLRTEVDHSRASQQQQQHEHQAALVAKDKQLGSVQQALRVQETIVSEMRGNLRNALIELSERNGNADSEQQLRQSNKRNEELQKEAATLSTALVECDRQLHQRNEQVERLQREVVAMTAERSTLTTALREKDTAIETLQRTAQVSYTSQAPGAGDTRNVGQEFYPCTTAPTGTTGQPAYHQYQQQLDYQAYYFQQHQYLQHQQVLGEQLNYYKQALANAQQQILLITAGQAIDMQTVARTNSQMPPISQDMQHLQSDIANPRKTPVHVTQQKASNLSNDVQRAKKKCVEHQEQCVLLTRILTKERKEKLWQLKWYTDQALQKERQSSLLYSNLEARLMIANAVTLEREQNADVQASIEQIKESVAQQLHDHRAELSAELAQLQMRVWELIDDRDATRYENMQLKLERTQLQRHVAALEGIQGTLHRTIKAALVALEKRNTEGVEALFRVSNEKYPDASGIERDLYVALYLPYYLSERVQRTGGGKTSAAVADASTAQQSGGLHVPAPPPPPPRPPAQPATSVVYVIDDDDTGVADVQQPQNLPAATLVEKKEDCCAATCEEEAIDEEQLHLELELGPEAGELQVEHEFEAGSEAGEIREPVALCTTATAANGCGGAGDPGCGDDASAAERSTSSVSTITVVQSSLPQPQSKKRARPQSRENSSVFYALKVTNAPPGRSGEAALRGLCGSLGLVQDMKRLTNRGESYVVQYVYGGEARHAQETMDGYVLDGYELSCQPYRDNTAAGAEPIIQLPLKKRPPPEERTEVLLHDPALVQTGTFEMSARPLAPRKAKPQQGERNTNCGDSLRPVLSDPVLTNRNPGNSSGGNKKRKRSKGGKGRGAQEHI